MISKEDLTSVYQDCYFKAGDGEIVIEEEGVTNQTADLGKVTLTGLNGNSL